MIDRTSYEYKLLVRLYQLLERGKRLKDKKFILTVWPNNCTFSTQRMHLLFRGCQNAFFSEIVILVYHYGLPMKQFLICACWTRRSDYMTRKRFIKLLMAHGCDRNTARDLAECINSAQRIGFIDSFAIKFFNGQKYQFGNVHSYREAYESTQKDGVSLV